ncbi:protein required for attachment to host cells [Virgibacillus halotolerans]|nr:protein required for attachment to host cells [Virgibacillus halotolerans]
MSLFERERRKSSDAGSKSSENSPDRATPAVNRARAAQIEREQPRSSGKGRKSSDAGSKSSENGPDRARKEESRATPAVNRARTAQIERERIKSV